MIFFETGRFCRICTGSTRGNARRRRGGLVGVRAVRLGLSILGPILGLGVFRVCWFVLVSLPFLFFDGMTGFTGFGYGVGWPSCPGAPIDRVGVLRGLRGVGSKTMDKLLTKGGMAFLSVPRRSIGTRYHSLTSKSSSTVSPARRVVS